MSNTDVSARGRCPQAWTRLSQQPKYVQLDELPDGGLRLAIKPDPHSLRKAVGFALAAMLFSALMSFCLFMLLRNELIENPFTRAKVALYLVLCISLAMIAGLVVLLVRVAGGPDRGSILEVRPGRLKIDRYISGDHSVREHLSSDITSICVSSRLSIEGKLDPFVLSTFVPRNLHTAIAELIGMTLWGDLAAMLHDVEINETHFRLLVREHRETSAYVYFPIGE